MTTLYCDPNGSDSSGDGSSANPYFSPYEAQKHVSAGDTIVMRDGVYDVSGAQYLNYSSGTSSDPITLKAADGATPVIDWNSPDSGGWGSDGDGSVQARNPHWVIEGITARNSPYMGFSTRTDDVTFRNCTAVNAYISGFYLRGRTRLEDCVSHGNSGTGGSSDGFGTYQANGTTFVECHAYDNSDDGFDLWGSYDCTLDSCLSHHNGYNGGDGSGFKMGGDDDSGNNTAKFCLSWENGAEGFRDNTVVEPNAVYNCTAWNNDSYGFASYSNERNEMANNIAYQNGSAVASGDAIETANSWDLGIDDPDFVTTDDGADRFLHLSSESPAVNAGVDVGLDYSGESPDIGAVESTHESSTPGPTVYYHDGSGWTEATLKYHDGSTFRPATVREL